MISNPDEGREATSEQVGEHVRIFRRGRIWHANYQYSGKQHRQSLKTSSKKQARLQALQIDAEMSRGTWKSSVTATIAETIDAYSAFLRAEERAPKTLSKYLKVFDRVVRLAEQRGETRISDISIRFMDAYRQLRSGAGAQAKTRYGECIIVRQLVNFALSRDMVAIDPLKGLKLTKPKPTPQPCWIHEQVQQILAMAPLDVRPALVLLAETGMRFGEMAWLTWDDVDMNANVLRIQPKEGWKPKSGDQRAIPMNKSLLAEIASLPRRSRWLVTMPPSQTRLSRDRQWTERRLLSALKRILKKLNLPGKLHTFRHSFISHALIEGVPVALVRKWVGHVDQATIDLYTHVHNAASQAAMKRLANSNGAHPTSPNGQGTDNRSAQNQHSNKENKDD